MHGAKRSGHGIRAAIVVAAATLLALAVPVGAPLYASIYPELDATTIRDAVAEANVVPAWGSDVVTQFETTTFSATLIYGTETDPDLPTVTVAWSNEAVLAADDPEAFTIVPTSDSRMFLTQGASRPEGGYELTWTWDVTPLKVGDQSLSLQIRPTVVVNGEVIPELADQNKPIDVSVAVHPAKQAFDEVVVAAGAMETHVPDEMIIGQEYDVSAEMSLAGHADTVTADIQLVAGEGSAKVTIKDASAAGPVAAQRASTASADDRIVRHWTVIVDEEGPVALRFTATVEGRAGTQTLQQEVPSSASAHAIQPPPSLWDRIIQQPVQLLTPIVVLVGGILGAVVAWRNIWVPWRKRREDAKNPGGPQATGGSADAAK